ncbi:MAG: TonB-dependent receptor [Opitutus sp.]|nr:TonB-dependent receptor [Opitutus sp.]
MTRSFKQRCASLHLCPRKKPIRVLVHRMKTKNLFFALGAFLALAPPSASAATDPGAPTFGTVTGRVLNLTTRQYVSSAEVRLQGTDLTATTASDGTFRLAPVPAGPAVIIVTYTGAKTDRSVVTVAAGQTVTLDFELRSATDRAQSEDVLQLGAFVVSSEREGYAKAIMEQRNSMNVTNSVSSEFFGDVAEGNVGEFLKNMPGVDLEYVGPDSRGPRLSGMDPQYVGVSVDGFKMASSDGSQGLGGGARSFSFDQVSINSIDRIEVNFTSSAEMDANAPAGTINLKTKRAFERKGRRISWQANFMANTDRFSLSPSYGPGDTQTRKFRPGGILEYSDVFLGNRLGVVLNISESNQYALQQRVTTNYNTTTTAADSRPYVLSNNVFVQQPKLSERFTPALTVDFKATPSLVLSLGAMYNWYDTFFDNRGVTVSAANRAAVIGDSLTNFRIGNGGGSLALSSNHSHKIARTRTLTPKFEYTRDGLVVDGALHYSISTNQYEAMSRIGPQNVPTNALNGLEFSVARSSPVEKDWRFTQTAGRDFADLANFANPRVVEEGRFAEDEIYLAQVNARVTTGWRVPTWFKVGTKATEEYRRYRNPNPANTYQYVGPGGGTTGSFAQVALPDYNWETDQVRVISTSGRVPVFPNRVLLGEQFREHPEYFLNTATPDNFYSAYITGAAYFKERFLANYAMANTKLGPVQLQGGLRWEDTQITDRAFAARSTAEVRAAGYPVAAATGRATTVPGLVYQYMSKPKTERTGGYENLFPSASVKYSITRNLQAHLGYSTTINRPPLSNLGGVYVFNESALTVNVPNPNLLPERGKNYTGRLAYYFEPVGSLAVTASQREITDSVTTVEYPASEFGYENDPTYSTYRFISSGNRAGVTRFRNLTVEYSQALSFLPGMLSGLNISGSYTRTYASVLRAGLVPHMAGGALSYRYKRFAFGVSAKYTDDTPFSTTGRINYRKQRTLYDLNGSLQLTAKTGLFFQVRDLFNGGEYRYELDPSYVRENVTFGTILTFGLKGVF